MSISKRTRFEVFKRDGFRCTYCGATPTDGPLHVDHVEPKAGGGLDEIDNLTTACGNCNLGKSDVPLEQRRPQREATEEQKEHAEQIREYLAVQREIRKAQDMVVAAVEDHWRQELGATPRILGGNLRGALKDFTVEELMEAIDIAASRFGPYGDRKEPTLNDWEWRAYVQAVKYWHGILRRWRTERRPK